MSGGVICMLDLITEQTGLERNQAYDRNTQYFCWQEFRVIRRHNSDTNTGLTNKRALGIVEVFVGYHIYPNEPTTSDTALREHDTSVAKY